MTTPSQSCRRELLTESLAEMLDERDEEELLRHLSSCAHCRNELERLAAGGDEWNRLASALKESSEKSDDDPPTVWDGSFVREGDDHADSYIDFAVDFLDAPQEQGSIGRLGEIEILEVIGRGGMGIVVKGFQQELNRPVAVKLLAPHLATSGAARKRFAREAQAAAAIVHPNVMPILSVNSTAKLPYLMMPYIACESLQERLDREGPLPVVDVLRIAVQTANGLAAAHAQGLIHRDVKPANILLEKGVDRVMLTDFGLARAVDDASLTRTGVIAGTPQYMSPEQARGESIDPCSDLFSLGSVLYALCTGRAPFRAETSYGILRRVSDGEPRAIEDLNPEIPAWLIGLIRKLHSKSPHDRGRSVADVARLLEQCLAHVQRPDAHPLPETVRSLSRPHTKWRLQLTRSSWHRLWRDAAAMFERHLALSLVILLSFAAAGGGIAWGVWSQSADSRSQASTASWAATPTLNDPNLGPPAGLDSFTSASTSESPSHLNWDDGISEDLQDLRQSVDRQLEEASRDWLFPAPTAHTEHSL